MLITIATDGTCRRLMCLFSFASVFGCQPVVTPAPNPNAIQAPLKRFVMIRAGNDSVALKLTKHTTTGDGGTKYEWYHQDDGTSDFSKSNVKSGTGEVYEQYSRTQTGLFTNEVNDIGGKYHINSGPFKIEWSKEDWLYIPPGLSIAITSWSQTTAINIDDSELVWKEFQ